MTNRKFWLGMLVMALAFGMTVFGCDDGSDDNGSSGNESGKEGKLTISGLDAYNGKYAFAIGETINDDYLFAAASISIINPVVTAGCINNGTVALKVWKQGLGFSGFNGNLTAVFDVMILNSATYNMAIGDDSNYAGGGYVSVTFIKGIGNGTFTTERPLPPGYSNATALTFNQWANGVFIKSTGTHWYSFSVTAEQSYYFWINDEYGNGNKTADVYVDAYYENGAYAFEGDDNWDDPVEFTAESTGKVYVKVSVSSSGTYAITYNTSGTRP